MDAKFKKHLFLIKCSFDVSKNVPEFSRTCVFELWSLKRHHYNVELATIDERKLRICRVALWEM